MPSTKNINALINAQNVGWADAAITRNAAARIALPALTMSQGTITAAAAIIDATATWNNAGVTFTGIKADITDTASDAASLLMDLQVGGASQFKVAKSAGVYVAGTLRLTSSGASLATIAQPSGYVTLTDYQGNQKLSLGSTSGEYVTAIGGLNIGTDYFTQSCVIRRDADDTFGFRRGTNPQTIRVYNTFTDASNYERGFMKWNSNVLEIGMEKGGTGTARNVRLKTDSGNSVTLEDGGLLTLNASLYLAWASRGTIRWPASGEMLLLDAPGSSFGRLQFGGTTSSFPSLKRSTTILQARLADDSDFAPLQGQLRTHANAATETIVADKTLTLYDAAGTAYKVPCVAA